MLPDTRRIILRVACHISPVTAVMMRTLKLTIAYDGTRYAGWQVQKHQNSKPTVQGTLEHVLRKILQEPVRVVGSGRTDAGVHALAQVAHVRTRSNLSEDRLLRGLNALLPRDVAVTRIESVDSSFHARFDASAKQYRYRVFTGLVVPPFIRPYVYHVFQPLNLSLMRREASVLCSRHDFRAFARAASLRNGTKRTISAMRIMRRGDELIFEVEGRGFLHTMVRSIAGTLLDVGRGHKPAGTIRRMLKSGSRRLAGTTAPARGLTLVSVGYKGAL